MTRANLYQLKQIIAKRFGIAIDAIAKIEIWNSIYFLVVKGRKPRFVSKKGFFLVPTGYGLTKRTNANIVSDNVFQVRYMAENVIVGTVEYVNGIFKANTTYNQQGLVGMTFNSIEKAVAFITTRHTIYLKFTITGF